MKTIKYASLCGLISLLIASSQVMAAFHLWRINEVYSNTDGSLQFIELFSTTAGQQFLANHDISVIDANGVTTVYTIPGNSETPTNNKHLLLATRDFQAVTGIEPDFIIPTRFIPLSGGNLSFVNVDQVDLTDLPLDGENSLAGDITTGPASPTNFSGDTSTIPSIAVEFDASAGSLTIDHVSVEGSGVYSAAFELVSSDPLTFDLIDAVMLSSEETQDLAFFSAASGLLTLPRVTVGEEIYSATLELVPNPQVLRFIVTGAELLE